MDTRILENVDQLPADRGHLFVNKSVMILLDAMLLPGFNGKHVTYSQLWLLQLMKKNLGVSLKSKKSVKSFTIENIS